MKKRRKERIPGSTTGEEMRRGSHDKVMADKALRIERKTGDSSEKMTGECTSTTESKQADNG